LGTDKEKIVAVENFLKKNFATREDINAQDAGNIEWIIKNSIASHQGIIRLYGAVFEKLGIDHQILLTCDRSECKIDKSFENWNNASDFLIYSLLPKVMAPTLLETRYPWINPYWVWGMPYSANHYHRELYHGVGGSEACSAGGLYAEFQQD